MTNVRIASIERVPLCRTYLAIATGSQAMPADESGRRSDGTVCWAMGFLSDGQCEAFGAWCRTEQGCSVTDDTLCELRLRGVERVHVVFGEGCGPSGLSVVPGAHVVPSMAFLAERCAADVGPRARGALGAAMRSMLAAASVQAAEAALASISAGRLGLRYPAVMAAWRECLPRLAPLYALPAELRRFLLLGDSAAQNLHRSLARSIRRHGAFRSREAALAFIRRRVGRAEFEFNTQRSRRASVWHEEALLAA